MGLTIVFGAWLESKPMKLDIDKINQTLVEEYTYMIGKDEGRGPHEQQYRERRAQQQIHLSSERTRNPHKHKADGA